MNVITHAHIKITCVLKCKKMFLAGMIMWDLVYSQSIFRLHIAPILFHQSIENVRWGLSFLVGGGKKNFGHAPPLFLALKVQLVVLVSSVMMVSRVWSVSCLLFFYSQCPCAQPFVKVGGGHVLMMTCKSRVHFQTFIWNLICLF